MVLNRPTPAPVGAPAPLIAALGSETGRAAMTASYDRVSGTLTVTPVSMETGKLYPELWVIPAGGSAHSLGIVTRDRPTQVIVAPEARAFLGTGATLAITPEPAGGAPGGKATGPVIASGTITTI
jgi:anti-sigma-K factor RskA